MSDIRPIPRPSRHSKANVPAGKAPFVSMLPVELLAYIFDIGRPAERDFSRTDTYPLIVSSVCRLWRNIAIRITPAIWNTITITIRRSLQLPSIYIERSGTSMLHVFINAFSSPTTDRAGCLGSPHMCAEWILGIAKLRRVHRKFLLTKLFKLISQHFHRFRDFSLLCSRDHFPAIMLFLRDIRAPKLQTFGVTCNTGHSFPPIFVDRGTPQLSSVVLSGISSFEDHTFPSSVTSLELHEVVLSQTKLFAFLNSFRCLQHLVLTETMLWAISFHGNPIMLPELITFDIQKGYSSEPLLYNLHAPSLRALRLCRSMDCNFDRPLPSVPSLDTLILWDVDVEIFFPEFYLAFPNVINLVLNCSTLRDLSDGRFWPLVDTLTIHSFYDPKVETMSNFVASVRQCANSRPVLKKIRLVLPGSPTPDGLEKAFEGIDVCVEILSSSNICVSDISNYIDKRFIQSE